MIHLEQAFTKFGDPERFIISYWDADGKKKVGTLPIKNDQKYNWDECSEQDAQKSKEYKSASGNAVKKVALKKYRGLSSYRVYEIMNQIPDDLKKKFFSGVMPVKTFFDIETESHPERDFPNADNPTDQVLTNVFVTEQKVEVMRRQEM